MKRLHIFWITMVLMLTLGGGFSARAAAQETSSSPWFPDGAEWYYGLFNQFELLGGTGCVHMTVAKDTLLAGRQCKQLKLEACDGKYETLYEYVSPQGDSLFYYNYAAQDFFLLLDMSAQKGDTVWVHKSDSIFIPNPGFDPYHRGHWAGYMDKVMAYRIMDIDTVVMAGQTLRRQRAVPIDYYVNGQLVSWWLFPGINGGYIVEGIGSLVYFFGEGEPGHLEWGHYELRCFFAEGKTYMTDGKCDNLVVDALVDLPVASWRLSPQPTRDRVRAVCTATEPGRRCGHWRLYDRTGKALQSGRFADGTFELSLTGCANGLYLVEIVADDGSACRLKCVKTE